MKVARAHLEEALCFRKSNKSSGERASLPNNYRFVAGEIGRLGKSVLFFRRSLDFEREFQRKETIPRGNEMFWIRESWFDEKRNYGNESVEIGCESFFFFFLLMVDRVFVSIRLNSFGLDFKLIKREKILNKIVYFLRYFLSISVNNYSNIFIFI